MYVQKIAIDIASDVDQDALMDEFGMLMSCYRNNGQLQGKHHTISQYLTHNTLVCLAHTLEIDSLHKKFNNAYVNQQMDTLERLCLSKLTFETLGKNPFRLPIGLYMRPAQFLHALHPFHHHRFSTHLWKLFQDCAFVSIAALQWP